MYGGLGVGAFATAYGATRLLRAGPSAEPEAAVAEPLAKDALGRDGSARAVEPDSVRLRKAGVPVGEHLVAFVFVSSRCGWCRDAAFRKALRGFPAAFRNRYTNEFAMVSTVLVNIDGDIAAGLSFLEGGIGVTTFDEIAVGRGWLNEQVREVIWDGGASAAVPEVVIARRQVSGEVQPFRVVFSSMRIVGVLTGHDAVMDWLRYGMPLAE